MGTTLKYEVCMQGINILDLLLLETGPTPC